MNGEKSMNDLMEYLRIRQRTVVVLRGVSGAGKSTLAKRLVAQATGAACIVSADDFFMEDGRYTFDPALLGEAHADCLRRFVEAVVFGRIEKGLVVVDNTNTTVAEAAPYMALAAAYGWHPILVTFDVPPIRAQSRNVHGVGPSTVMAQASRMALDAGSIPAFWPHLTLASGTDAREAA